MNSQGKPGCRRQRVVGEEPGPTGSTVSAAGALLGGIGGAVVSTRPYAPMASTMTVRITSQRRCRRAGRLRTQGSNPP